MPDMSYEKAVELLTALRKDEDHTITPDDLEALSMAIALLREKSQAIFDFTP